MEKMEDENQEISPGNSQAKQQTHIIITPTCPVNPSQNVDPIYRRKVTNFLRLKILTVALGTIIMGVGGYAFFESTWNKQYQHNRKPDIAYIQSRPHNERIGLIGPKKQGYLFDLECIFVSITLIVYMLSIGNLLFTFDADYKIAIYNWEKVFHVMAGICLFIGGAMNLFSANVVLNSTALEERKGGDSNMILIFDRNIYQLYDAKMVAGCLSFVNALLYLTTSGFVPKANAEVK